LVGDGDVRFLRDGRANEWWLLGKGEPCERERELAGLCGMIHPP
jgi:hypothetical protein